jgi:hypothetical protein
MSCCMPHGSGWSSFGREKAPRPDGIRPRISRMREDMLAILAAPEMNEAESARVVFSYP